MLGGSDKPVKMTVIFEEDGETSTIVVHRAKNVKLHVLYDRIQSEDMYQRSEFELVAPPSGIHFSFEGQGEFDQESGTHISQMYSSEKEKVGKTTSKLTPRELRRARYGGPRGGMPTLGLSQELIDKITGKGKADV